MTLAVLLAAAGLYVGDSKLRPVIIGERRGGRDKRRAATLTAAELLANDSDARRRRIRTRSLVIRV